MSERPKGVEYVIQLGDTLYFTNRDDMQYQNKISDAMRYPTAAEAAAEVASILDTERWWI